MLKHVQVSGAARRCSCTQFGAGHPHLPAVHRRHDNHRGTALIGTTDRRTRRGTALTRATTRRAIDSRPIDSRNRAARRHRRRSHGTRFTTNHNLK